MIGRLPSLPSRLKARLTGSASIEEHFAIPVDREARSLPKREAITLDGKPLSGARFLGVSKSGSLSWAGSWDGVNVKIYRTFNANQARFIEAVSKQPILRDYFPKVFLVEDEYIVAEWIEGESLNEVQIARKPHYIEAMAQMQADFHTRALPGETLLGFDYKDHLLQRLQRYRGLLPVSDSIQYLLQVIERDEPDGVMRLSHADVTLKNLVVEKATGRLKLIDNEFLSFSNYFGIDLFNTHRCLRYSENLARQYINAYHRHGGDATLILENSHFFLALWGLRIIVTTMQTGHTERAYQLADKMLSGEFRHHPLLSLIGETLE